jgi:hypothetical protein
VRGLTARIKASAFARDLSLGRSFVRGLMLDHDVLDDGMRVHLVLVALTLTQAHFGHRPFGFQSLSMVIQGCDVS